MMIYYLLMYSLLLKYPSKPVSHAVRLQCSWGFAWAMSYTPSMVISPVPFPCLLLLLSLLLPGSPTSLLRVPKRTLQKNETKFQEQAAVTRRCFEEKGYPNKLVNKAYNKAYALSQEACLREKEPSKLENQSKTNVFISSQRTIDHNLI